MCYNDFLYKFSQMEQLFYFCLYNINLKIKEKIMGCIGSSQNPLTCPSGHALKTRLKPEKVKHCTSSAEPIVEPYAACE